MRTTRRNAVQHLYIPIKYGGKKEDLSFGNNEFIISNMVVFLLAFDSVGALAEENSTKKCYTSNWIY